MNDRRNLLILAGVVLAGFLLGRETAPPRCPTSPGADGNGSIVIPVGPNRPKPGPWDNQDPWNGPQPPYPPPAPK